MKNKLFKPIPVTERLPSVGRVNVIAPGWTGGDITAVEFDGKDFIDDLMLPGIKEDVPITEHVTHWLEVVDCVTGDTVEDSPMRQQLHRLISQHASRSKTMHTLHVDLPRALQGTHGSLSRKQYKKLMKAVDTLDCDIHDLWTEEEKSASRIPMQLEQIDYLLSLAIAGISLDDFCRFVEGGMEYVPQFAYLTTPQTPTPPET